MKKGLLILFFATALLRSELFAQPVATTGTVEYQKGNKSAAIIELPYGSDVVEKALKEHFLKQGIKEEKIKGFQVFKGARLSPTDGEVVDLYFKVDRKSRKDPNSNVYMIVGRPNENVQLRVDGDSFKIEEGKTFLTELTPSIDAYNLEVTIAGQEETIKKAEKKMKNLQDDQADMEKKIRNLEDKLEQNRRDQDAQNAELSKQRSVRDAMQARRTNPGMVQ